MNTIEEKLMKLYWMLWVDENFNLDFARDWRIVWLELQKGNHYSIPEPIIDLCMQYMADWEKEN